MQKAKRVQVTGSFSRRDILGNALSLTAGSAIAQGLMAVSTLIVARVLGATAFGAYAASFSAAALLSIGFNLGLDTWLLRAGAERRDRLGGLLRNALAIKVVAGVPWIVAVTILLPALNAETFRPSIVLISALTVWLEGLFSLGLTVFRTLLRNGTTALLMTVSRGGIFVLTAGLALAGERAVAPYALARLAMSGLAALIAWRLVPVRLTRDQALAPLGTAKASLPFALSDLFAVVYVQADITIAGAVLGAEPVGLYAPASSIVSALLVVPAALFYVAVPVLTAALGGEKLRFRRLTRWTMGVFGATGFGLWAITWLAASILPTLLGPSYYGSGRLLQILSPILLLKGFSFGAAAILVAVGWQVKRATVQAVTALLNVALNLAVVGTLGITGVAAVYVISELFLMGGYLALVARWRRMTDD